MTSQPVLRGFLADPNRAPPLVVTFPFNPASLQDNRSLSYEEAPNADRPEDATANYRGSSGRTIRFSFQLHGLEEGTNPIPIPTHAGISTELAKLRSFLYPREDAWATWGGPGTEQERGVWLKAPPRCIFGFGARLLECQVTSLEIEETQFNAALAPVRAEVSVSLTVVEEEGNALAAYDRQQRLALAAIGLFNVRPF